MPVDDGTAGMMDNIGRKLLFSKIHRPIGEPLDEVRHCSTLAAPSMRRHASSRLASELANETRKYGERP